MQHMPQPRPDYSVLKVPAPVKGLVQSVTDKGGYDRVVFTTENQTRYVVYVPHHDERLKSGLRKGHGLILRRASDADPFGVMSVRAFLETGQEKGRPLSQWQTVRVGLVPFFLKEADVKTPVIAGKVDEIVQWEQGWHSLVVNAYRLRHISIPEGDLRRASVYGQPEEDAPRARVASQDRVIAFPQRNVAFFYPRKGWIQRGQCGKIIPVSFCYLTGAPMKEYKVLVYREPLLGSLILGESKVNPVKFTEFLNMNAKEGWRVVTMERERRRELLFFSREAYLVVMEKEKV